MLQEAFYSRLRVADVIVRARTSTVRVQSIQTFFQNESHPIRPICPSANLWVGAGILCKQPELEQNFLVS